MRVRFVLVFGSLAIALLGVVAVAENIPRIESSVDLIEYDGREVHAVAEKDGTIHLISTRSSGDGIEILYSCRASESNDFGESVSVTGPTVRAIGATGGPQLALGRAGRPHVVWHGKKVASDAPAGIFYSRLNDAGVAFEPPRSLASEGIHGLSGGASLAADRSGNVMVVWHGAPETYESELDRAPWFVYSSDDGQTFSPDTSFGQPGALGACSCCSAKAFTSGDANVYVAYRTAEGLVRRSATLLRGRFGDVAFDATPLQTWELAYCPNAGFDMVARGNGVGVAWENENRPFFAVYDLARGALSEPVSLLTPSDGLSGAQVHPRKHPVMATNENGETLVAWNVGDPSRGVRGFEWRKIDAAGEPVGDVGRFAYPKPRRDPGLSVIVGPNDEFTLLYGSGTGD